jgi:small subunit ribosomal protein S17
MATETEQQDRTQQGHRKTRTGFVVSNDMDKTAVVAVTRQFMHPLYKKYVRDRTHYKAHDRDNDVRPGDKVLIEETRPLSKDKRWRVREVLDRAPVV